MNCVWKLRFVTIESDNIGFVSLQKDQISWL